MPSSLYDQQLGSLQTDADTYVAYANATATALSNYVYQFQTGVTNAITIDGAAAYVTAGQIYSTCGSPTYIQTYVFNTTPESDEAKAARLAAEAERAKQRAEAKCRAEVLLLSILNPEQKAQFEANGWFETEVNDTTYRIHRARSMNVEKIVAGKPTHKYCAHPGDMTPDEDVMLAQLLMLRTNEAKFLATANVRML